MSINPEEKIITLLSKGQVELAFNEIISMYQERLYWHIRNMVMNHEDADDVLQNTYVKIWKNLENFQGRSKLFSWMYRIATNETLSFLEKRKRKQAASLDHLEVYSNQLVADEFFDGDALAAMLRSAVEDLPTKQKQVFIMKYFDDLKYSEMAEILSMSVGGLKASYHHAVKKIEAYIKAKAIEI